MFERIKNVVKSAIKNVWFNKKQYICFVILLIFLQSLISCIFLFNHNNNKNELRYLENEFRYEINGKEYPYHIVINNLTEEQYNLYQQSEGGTETRQRYFSHVYERVTSSTGTRSRYYLYVNFYNNNHPDASPYELYQSFTKRSEIKTLREEGVVITQTPLLLSYRSMFVNSSISTLICILVTALGALTFGILFNTVINHFKFSYGVYMTYGANFKKLLSAALTEMLILNFVTFIPAYLISVLIAFFLTSSAGYGISIILYPMFIALLCSLILTVVSVTVVIKRVSLYTPDKLLRSVNNESMIKSPRRSKRLPDNSFPFRPEMLSMKRFRKYVISLMLTTLLFAGAFCAGSYMMEAQAAKDNAKAPQFTLHFPTKSIYDETTVAQTTTDTPEETTEPKDIVDTPGESASGRTYDEGMRELLYGVEGVDKVIKSRTREATMERSHILIHSSKLTWDGESNGLESETNGYYGFANVDYTLFDEEVADGLLYLGATIEGDWRSVLNDNKTIAISDSLNNELIHKLKVGDKIKIVSSAIRRRPLSNTQPTSANHLLEMLYRAYDFHYDEYTVGAIVSGLSVKENIPVYMNAQCFNKVTGETPYFVDVSIYCEDGVSEETVRNMERSFRMLGSRYNVTISNTRQETIKATNQLKNYPGLILYVSVLLLLIYILITALSQALFYQMRKKELDIYLCLGANFKKIRKLFFVDAAFFALLSTVFYSFFAWLTTWIVYEVIHGDFAVWLDFYIPVWAFFAGLGVSLLTAVMTVMLSYRSFKKHSAPVFTGKAVLLVKPSEERNEIFDSDAR